LSVLANNLCHLEGTVQAYSMYGDNWTRWRSPRQGIARGQVRFWLALSRELAGDGLDVVLCAIEPCDEIEVKRYQEEIRGGRTVRLEARACSMADPEHPGESSPGVVFVAESCGFDGAKPHDVHSRKHLRPQGKLAAAADDSVGELPLNQEVQR